MFQNIIWDVDGTLFDTYPAIVKAFQSALNSFGYDAPTDWVESLAKQSLGHCATTLANKYQLSEAELDRAFGEQYDRIGPTEQPPFAGVKAICAYICSLGGKNVIVTHRGLKSTQELLAAHQMSQLFSGLITRNDGYPKKPNPSAFQAIIQQHHLPVDETLTIGDRDIDILAGKAAGLFACLFGSSDEAEADLTISNYAELQHFLIAQNTESEKL